MACTAEEVLILQGGQQGRDLVAKLFVDAGDVIVTAVFFSVLLLGLYFISILVAWIAEPRQPK